MTGVTGATERAWRNRVVGYGEEPPDQLLANPLNWRIHPLAQQQQIEAVLDEVGWVAPVTVNVRTGCVVDGHMRVAVALSREEPTVPVAFVDLTEEEEQVMLATFDAIGRGAVPERAVLRDLLESARTASARVEALLAQLHGPESLLALTEQPPVVTPIQVAVDFPAVTVTVRDRHVVPELVRTLREVVDRHPEWGAHLRAG